MEDEERDVDVRVARERRPDRFWFYHSEFWNNTVFSMSYWFFEIVCFAALLSMSIGMSALSSLASEYFLEQKLSIFLQTYITLFVLYNFGNFQARHQIVYIFPLRIRFGNQLKYCFACNYPCSTSFFFLLIAYVNLFCQFSRLLCPWEFPDDSVNRRTGSFQDLKDSSNLKFSHSKGQDHFLNPNHVSVSLPDDDSSSNLPPATDFDMFASGSGSGVTKMMALPDMGLLTTTTALFLLSLCSIQYLTCRKLKWDYYLEASRIQHPPNFPSCCNFLYALFVLLFIQLVLIVLYSMPILMWLLLAKLFEWHLSTTLITTVAWSIIIGLLAAFVEKQEPFPTVNHSRMYQLLNLKLRSYLLCLAYIPGLFYWFVAMEETSCIFPELQGQGQGQRRGEHDQRQGLESNHVSTLVPKSLSISMSNVSKSSLNQNQFSHGSTPSHLDMFNLFLLNISLCIISTTKYTRLSSIDRRRHEVEPMHLHLHHRHHGNDNLLGGAPRVAHIQNDPNLPPPARAQGHGPGRQLIELRNPQHPAGTSGNENNNNSTQSDVQETPVSRTTAYETGIEIGVGVSSRSRVMSLSKSKTRTSLTLAVDNQGNLMRTTREKVIAKEKSRISNLQGTHRNNTKTDLETSFQVATLVASGSTSPSRSKNQEYLCQDPRGHDIEQIERSHSHVSGSDFRLESRETRNTVKVEVKDTEVKAIIYKENDGKAKMEKEKLAKEEFVNLNSERLTLTVAPVPVLCLDSNLKLVQEKRQKRELSSHELGPDHDLGSVADLSATVTQGSTEVTKVHS